jgi:hypothetical protein
MMFIDKLYKMLYIMKYVQCAQVEKIQLFNAFKWTQKHVNLHAIGKNMLEKNMVQVVCCIDPVHIFGIWIVIIWYKV